MNTGLEPTESLRAGDISEELVRCGHYPAEERPGELARTILNFLAMTPLQRKDRQ